MKRICTVCARGGSKGVKNKNIRELVDRPLIAFTLQQARISGLFDLVAVSSDSPEILGIASAYGADYLIRRPDQLATDQAAKIPVIRHCVSEVEQACGISFDTIVDLDATSPLRDVEDIAQAVRLHETRGVANVITGAPARRSPYFNLVEVNGAGAAVLSKPPLKQLVRRQDSPRCFDMNASIYVWRREVLFGSDSVFNQDTLLYEMPENRSIDIDSELDFEFVEFLMRRRLNGNV